MKNFIKQSWFKLVIAGIVILIGISVFYYFVILSAQKESRIKQQTEIDLMRKNAEEIEQKAKEETEAQKAKQDAWFTDWVKQCITDAYNELKTLQNNYDVAELTSCAEFHRCFSELTEKAKNEAFKTYQEEWVPQCRLGNRVFIDYEPMKYP